MWSCRRRRAQRRRGSQRGQRRGSSWRRCQRRRQRLQRPARGCLPATNELNNLWPMQKSQGKTESGSAIETNRANKGDVANLANTRTMQQWATTQQTTTCVPDPLAPSQVISAHPAHSAPCGVAFGDLVACGGLHRGSFISMTRRRRQEVGNFVELGAVLAEARTRCHELCALARVLRRTEQKEMSHTSSTRNS